MRSKVKWFDNEEGYGFIEYRKNNIFVHYEIKKDNVKTVELILIKTNEGFKIKKRLEN